MNTVIIQQLERKLHSWEREPKSEAQKAMIRRYKGLIAQAKKDMEAR